MNRRNLLAGITALPLLTLPEWEPVEAAELAAHLRLFDAAETEVRRYMSVGTEWMGAAYPEFLVEAWLDHRHFPEWATSSTFKMLTNRNAFRMVLSVNTAWYLSPYGPFRIGSMVGKDYQGGEFMRATIL